MTPWMRMGFLSGLFACVCLGVGCATTPRDATTPTPQPMFDLSPADRQQARAFAEFTAARILDDNPKTAAQAIDHYVIAASFDPSRQLLYSSAAQTAVRDLDIPRAIEILKKDIAKNPKNTDALLELGEVQQIGGDRTNAAACFEQVITLAPTNIPAYLYLSGIYFSQNQDRQALELLKRGIAHSPGRAMLGAYCYRIGKELVDAQEFTRAIHCFELVADSTEEGSGLIHHLLGTLYESQQDMTNAMIHYTAAAAATPPVSEAIVKLALFHMPAEPDKALAILQEAMTRTTDTNDLLFAKALIYREANRIPESLATYEAIRAANKGTNEPLTDTFYVSYADTYAMSGDTNRAEQLLLECITVHPDSHQAMNYLAYTWAENGVKLDKALSYAKQALSLNPKNGAYMDTLGWVYFKQGDNDKALKTLLEAKAEMDDPVITEHVGDVLLAIGKKDSAITQWQHSLALDPSSESVRTKLSAQGVTNFPAASIETNAPTLQVR